MQLNTRKMNQPNQKVGRRTKQTFLQRRHTDGLETHAKMLNIINYQRNANQNHNEVPFHSKVVAIQKSASNKCWRGCGEKGTLLQCWWECKLVWASLIAQLVKNLPAMQETSVRFLGQEDSLEKG